MQTLMKNSLPLLLLLVPLTINACASAETIIPTPRATAVPRLTIPAQTVPTQIPTDVAPTKTDPVADRKTYANSEFGLEFEYPSNWFGPTEYVSDQMLRLEIGSDVVYPYGTDPTLRVYELKNSYVVLIQYSKNDQNTYWKETYQSLVDLAEGESLSTARSKVIKVKDLELGRFKGVEYISTLSDTAQTEPVYLRQVILFDDQSNVLTVMGQPNNVWLGEGIGWRQEYQRIDGANAALFHQILESIEAE